LKSWENDAEIEEVDFYHIAKDAVAYIEQLLKHMGYTMAKSTSQEILEVIQAELDLGEIVGDIKK
jgi:4-hydroxyphenylpyruvate dioxygenase-like putative hemolysin